MKAQSNSPTCDITVGIDHGSLRLQFPARHLPLWEILKGKPLPKGKPFYLPLGRQGYKDNPDDIKRASTLAMQLEADLDHPEWEKLFDPTLAKYGIGSAKYGKLADVLQMPGVAVALPEITVGAMWDAYLEWKRTVVEETTFKTRYGGMTNLINGKVWIKSEHRFSCSSAPLHSCTLDQQAGIETALTLIVIAKKQYLQSELAKAFEFCKSKGLIVNSTTENPFDTGKFTTPVVTTQQKYASKMVDGVEKQWHEVQDEKVLELDHRAFTKDERDIIIKAFYKSSKASERYLAPLIEFYFLTGCRTSEAIPLNWTDIDFDRNIIRFSKSMGVNTGKVKDTKTGEIRLFYFNEASRLKKLLLELKADSNGTLVFPNEKEKYISYYSTARAWKGRATTQNLADGTKKKYANPGLVTRLAEQGVISGYLSQYHTRHTFITLTAHANAHDNNALLKIANSCGNSVDVILRHYLGVVESTGFIEI